MRELYGNNRVGRCCYHWVTNALQKSNC